MIPTKVNQQHPDHGYETRHSCSRISFCLANSGGREILTFDLVLHVFFLKKREFPLFYFLKDTHDHLVPAQGQMPLVQGPVHARGSLGGFPGSSWMTYFFF